MNSMPVKGHDRNREFDEERAAKFIRSELLKEGIDVDLTFLLTLLDIEFRYMQHIGLIDDKRRWPRGWRWVKT